MSAAELRDHTESHGHDDAGTDHRLSLTPDAVEVRRNAGVAAAVGVLASTVAIAYLGRAVDSGAVLDWAFVAVMGAIGIAWLAAFLDSRTPLLVADTQGVRLRLGRTWRGLPWSAVQRVEHTPRRGLLRDGRLAVVARNPEKVLSELDTPGRRRARMAQRMHGEPFAVPLGLSTRVVGGGDDVQAALERVAAQAAEVVVVEPVELAETEPALGHDTEPDTHLATGPDTELEPADGEELEEAVEVEDRDTHDTGDTAPRLRDPRPRLAAGIARLAALVPARRDAVETSDPEAPGAADEADPETDQHTDQHADWAPEPVATPTPSPLRESGPARRAEVRRDLPATPEDEEDQPAGRELRRPGSVSLVEETQVWGDRVRPIARQGQPVDPIVLDDFAIEPADDPVVGPEVAAARTRLGLTVDQLADRTRIRPHVIESIEVDDFVPCGGDFYARGHLRTLARVLGIDVAPLLTAYDERYAHAPISPRRVFEAELATGASGSIRSTRGGPNWSALVAVVMALILCWSVARLVMDTPPELEGAPVLNGSGGPGTSGSTSAAEPVDVVVSAESGGAHVVVRDADGEIVFKGNLAAGDSRELRASPPLRVQSTDGAVTVSLDGDAPRPVGTAGEAGQGTFEPR